MMTLATQVIYSGLYLRCNGAKAAAISAFKIENAWNQNQHDATYCKIFAFVPKYLPRSSFKIIPPMLQPKFNNKTE